MTIIEFIKNFKEYNIGDFIVYKDEFDKFNLFQVIDTPKFFMGTSGHSYNIDCDYYPNESDNTTDDFEYAKESSPWIFPFGYRLRYADGVRSTSRLNDKRDVLFALYEPFDPIKHPELIETHERFLKLLQIEELRKQL